MSRNKKQKDPFRMLVRGVILLALVALVFGVIHYGLNAYGAHVLAQSREDTEARNKVIIAQHNAAQAEYESAMQKGENLNWPSPKKEGWDVVDLSAFALENTKRDVVIREDLLVGGMMLVNQWHALPADFSDAGVKAVGEATSWKVGAANNFVKLFDPAIKALQLMVEDAEAAGLKHYFVSEGYRTHARQQEMFDEEMQRLQERYNYSGDTLIEQTKKKVNYPGTSEYQSGFSFSLGLYSKDDPNVVKLVFQESDQGKWVTENCWKYGFIFRFPNQDFPNSSWTDKSFKTGVSVKLNLYRWVGTPHATIMRQLDLCLEEYVEYLMERPHLAVYENGNLRYEIFRKQVGDVAAVEIDVPLAASSYLASLDNMGGVVIAYIY